MDASRPELVFLPLGGAGEIGMNLSAYGYGTAAERQWIIVDCGVLFGREGPTPGIDLIMPDIRFLSEQKRNVRGLVLTHAHEDHIGAVPYLWPQLECPIYATPFTARLLQHKLLEADLLDRAPVRIVPLGGRIDIGPFSIAYMSITHSIPEPNTVAVETPLGTIVHTGDWKLDPEPLLGETTDQNTFQALGDRGVLALVCDSTNALVSGRSGSESRVRQSLSDLIGTLKGRIAVTAFASNAARLASIADAARRHGRELALVGHAMHRIVAAARESGYLSDFPATVDEADAAKLPRERILYLCTGSQGEPRAALARIANGQHPHVQLGAGDAVVFSSRIIPGNELAIFDIQNRLAALGVEVLTERDHFVHVSGHPAREELAQMYRWVRPRIAVPVHGEFRHMMEHARLARALQVPEAVVVENGQMLRLAPGKAEIVDETPAGRVYLDGKVLVDDSHDHVSERRALAFAGVIAVTLALDSKGRVAAEPVSVMEGIPDVIHGAVREAVDDAVRRHNPKRASEDLLKENVRRAARRAALDAWGKKPLTRVEFVRV